MTDWSSVKAQQSDITLPITFGAYYVLDAMANQNGEALLMELLAVYCSETDERRDALMLALRKYAALDGKTL